MPYSRGEDQCDCPLSVVRCQLQMGGSFMHILYVHQNFPAQFGHIARHLVKTLGWRCTFVSETAPGNVEGIEKIQYKIAGGATKTTHFCSRTFENAVWHTDAVYNALKARGADLQP